MLHTRRICIQIDDREGDILSMTLLTHQTCLEDRQVFTVHAGLAVDPALFGAPYELPAFGIELVTEIIPCEAVDHLRRFQWIGTPQFIPIEKPCNFLGLSQLGKDQSDRILQ